MKSKCMKLSLGMLILFFSSQPLFAASQIEDPTFSKIDGMSYSDLSINCEDFHNSEACELFRAKESYSLRDGLSYADCSVSCDDMLEFDSCFSYRQSHPCEDISLTRTVASTD